MSHPRVADRERSVLLLIDLQESYRGKLHEEERTLRATARLLDAARILDIPVILTEQYPERLGPTREEISLQLPDSVARFAKRSFSCLAADGLRAHLEQLGRKQLVLAGIETHVCVGQTGHDLLQAGFQVYAVRDAITARFPLDDDVGFAKLTGSGAIPISVEGVLFEWVRDSRAPEFKAIHHLVR
ncbi:MAG: isochorismatase family protein [Myxococcota bacterium]